MSSKNIRRMEHSNVVSNFVWQVAAVWGALASCCGLGRSNGIIDITDSHVYHEDRQGATSWGCLSNSTSSSHPTMLDDGKQSNEQRVTGINAAHKAWKTRSTTDRSKVTKNAWITRRERYGPSGIGQ